MGTRPWTAALAAVVLTGCGTPGPVAGADLVVTADDAVTVENVIHFDVAGDTLVVHHQEDRPRKDSFLMAFGVDVPRPPFHLLHLTTDGSVERTRAIGDTRHLAALDQDVFVVTNGLPSRVPATGALSTVDLTAFPTGPINVVEATPDGLVLVAGGWIGWADRDGNVLQEAEVDGMAWVRDAAVGVDGAIHVVTRDEYASPEDPAELWTIDPEGALVGRVPVAPDRGPDEWDPDAVWVDVDTEGRVAVGTPQHVIVVTNGSMETVDLGQQIFGLGFDGEDRLWVASQQRFHRLEL